MYIYPCLLVTDYSRKTGDFGSLSATDIKVLALTYMLEAAHVGTDHLKENPTIKRTVDFYQPSLEVQEQGNASSKIPGFYMPSEESDEDSENDTEDDTESKNTIEKETSDDIQYFNDLNGIDGAIADALENADLGCDPDEDKVSYGDGSEMYNEDNADNDDDSWITPSNYVRKKGHMAVANEKQLLKKVEVACMTSDFAMQVTRNVIKFLVHLTSKTFLIGAIKTLFYSGNYDKLLICRMCYYPWAYMLLLPPVN